MLLLFVIADVGVVGVDADVGVDVGVDGVVLGVVFSMNISAH